MRLITLAAMAALLAGCATDPTPLDKISSPPPSRIWAPPPPRSTPPAKVTFVRDTGSLFRDAQITVEIDGRKVAVLMPGEGVTFEVEPGERQFGARHDYAPPQAVKPLLLDAKAEPDRPLLYRVGYQGGGSSPALVFQRDVVGAR